MEEIFEYRKWLPMSNAPSRSYTYYAYRRRQSVCGCISLPKAPSSINILGGQRGMEERERRGGKAAFASDEWASKLIAYKYGASLSRRTPHTTRGRFHFAGRGRRGGKTRRRKYHL